MLGEQSNSKLSESPGVEVVTQPRDSASTSDASLQQLLKLLAQKDTLEKLQAMLNTK